jgi:putative two-component system response regulator
VFDADFKGARIVIADDQEANVELVEALLEQAGYSNLVSTTDSSQALALCAQAAPDLVILDLHMPSPDGFEVLELLKPWIEGRWFPVLVLTADATSEVKHRALSNGAKDFLTKPLDRTEVLIRVRNLLEVRYLQLELRRQTLEAEGVMSQESTGSAQRDGTSESI